jgi:hypothetical protein
MSRAALLHLRANILVRAVKAAKTQQVKPSDKERRNRSWRLSLRASGGNRYRLS